MSIFEFWFWVLMSALLLYNAWTGDRWIHGERWGKRTGPKGKKCDGNCEECEKCKDEET